MKIITPETIDILDSILKVETTEYQGSTKLFRINNIIPAFPIKIYEQIWCVGWDIPTMFAIDANNICWMDDAHGGALAVVKPEVLFKEITDEERRNKLREILSLPKEEPSWANKARSLGWTPPKDWPW